MSTQVQFKDYSMGFKDDDGKVYNLIDHLNMQLDEGKALGIVGESGCGKSMTSLSLMRLLPAAASVQGGEILLNGEDLLKKSEPEMEKIRGKQIAMIFQEPMTALNPVMTIGKQIGECLKLHHPEMKEDEIRKQVCEALNDVGIDLSGYRYDEDSKHLFTQRTINGKVYELPFEAESDGTKKMIAALPVLMVALQEGRTVVVDELDAKLHPKLLRYVIQMFKNPELNKKGAQLLFSSHDLTTMKNTVFRRDEIWFAAMNDNHESEIYSLYEFRQEDNTRVKSTAAFDKQYLEGRYGADPYLSNMLTGRDWA